VRAHGLVHLKLFGHYFALLAALQEGVQVQVGQGHEVLLGPECIVHFYFEVPEVLQIDYFVFTGHDFAVGPVSWRKVGVLFGSVKGTPHESLEVTLVVLLVCDPCDTDDHLEVFFPGHHVAHLHEVSERLVLLAEECDVVL